MATSDLLGAIGNTPLVELTRIGRGAAVPIFAKCEHMNPGGSVKDRIARAIIEDAEAKGLLQSGTTLVEATAGNTGIGLALVAAARGYKLVCVMPEKMSSDKRAALTDMGARLVLTPDVPASDSEHFVRVAKRLADDEGWFLTDQFENPANPRVHEETTGPEIARQLGRPVGDFVSGSGTGGTISGVGRFLKKVSPTTRVVLADPKGSSLAEWVRTGTLGPSGSYSVEGIGAGRIYGNLDGSVIDEAEVISDEESFAMARRLVREEGLLVGGSAGTNVAAALRIAERGDVDGPVVTILCDRWDRYRTQPWMQGWSTSDTNLGR